MSGGGFPLSGRVGQFERTDGSTFSRVVNGTMVVDPGLTHLQAPQRPPMRTLAPKQRATQTAIRTGRMRG
jgi:hypothetical protein